MLWCEFDWFGFVLLLLVFVLFLYGVEWIGLMFGIVVVVSLVLLFIVFLCFECC